MKSNIKNIKIVFWIISCSVLLACSSSKSQKSWQLGENTSQYASISKNLKYILTTPLNAPVELWQLGRKAKGKYAWSFPATLPINYIVSDLSTPKFYAVTASGPYIIVWDTRTGKSRAFWQLPFKITEIKASQTNLLSLVRTDKGQVKMLDLRTGRTHFSIPIAKKDQATRIAFADNSHYFAVGTKSGRVHLWNMKTKKLRYTLKLGKKISFLKFSRHGKKLLTSTYTGLTQIWHTPSGKRISTLKANGDLYKVRQVPAPVIAAQFSPKGHLLATGAPGGVVRIWRVKTGYIHQDWQIPTTGFWSRHPPTVLDLAFTSKAKSVITVTIENEAALWKLH